MRTNRFLFFFVILTLLIVPLSTMVNAQDEQTFVIGVSNSFVGSEWRTQFIQQIETVVDEFNNDPDDGVQLELIIESEDTDVAGQIQQLQNLVNRGADAIIINPGDRLGLNADLEEIAAEGVVVISVDQEIPAEGVINVVINQNTWAKVSARWLAEKLGGEGQIVLVEGLAGHPANIARVDGALEVFDGFEGIEIIGQDNGNWDQATGQAVMSDFLASLPDIDGVWTQDGMADGVLRALRSASNEDLPVTTGEARASFLQQWQEVREDGEIEDFDTIGVVNPPGIGASGVRIAVELLLGNELDEDQLQVSFKLDEDEPDVQNTLYVDIPFAVVSDDAEDIAEVLREEFGIEVDTFSNVFGELDIANQPGSLTLDGVISQEEAGEFFVNGSLIAQED